MKLYIQPLKAGNSVSACLTLWEWLSNYGASRRWDMLHSFKMAPPRQFNDVETQESFHGVKWESVTHSQIHRTIKVPMCEYRQRSGQEYKLSEGLALGGKITARLSCCPLLLSICCLYRVLRD